ncbi:uncharacterized protein LOC124817261 [Hydra vulgaris]|uniref:uncharacterized protein LOC124817261 n=1 Tax=Hydra vulgaris TaxID=6087 RepID=UPI001F5F55C2|nr:uncharacterized protein LOC124817261 [Hydra vulgaris]
MFSDFGKALPKLIANPDINIDTVIKKLSKLNVNKSTGEDKVHPRVLKECSNSISNPLSTIFNRSYSSGITPRIWQCANIIPILKKGDKLKATNYRLVSLTSVVRKVMENIIRDALVEHLVENKLKSNSQHGFVRCKNCCTNLLESLDLIAQSVELGFSIDIAFLDFSKAFDTVTHKRLLIKLKAYCEYEVLVN